jgi:YggT family protein
MGLFLFQVLSGLISLAEFLIIAAAILSWLVAFDVINLRNPTVARILGGLDAVTRPMLAPFRRFIPPIGGIDITPIVALIVLEAIRTALLPWIFRPLIGALGG